MGLYQSLACHMQLNGENYLSCVYVIIQGYTLEGQTPKLDFSPKQIHLYKHL